MSKHLHVGDMDLGEIESRRTLPGFKAWLTTRSDGWWFVAVQDSTMRTAFVGFLREEKHPEAAARDVFAGLTPDKASKILRGEGYDA
jgi:hypothetical protein